MQRIVVRLLVVAVLAMGATAVAEQLYALSSYVNPRLLELDPTNGGILHSYTVTNSQALFGGLAVDAQGKLYSIDGYNDENPDRLFRIDRTSGDGSVVGPTGFNWNFRSVSVHPVTGVLYGMTDGSLYTIDPLTGAATLVALLSDPSLDQATAFAIDSHGNGFLTDIGNTSLFALDVTNGQLTFIGDCGDSSNWFEDLTFDHNDVLYGVRLNGGVYTINTNDATLTFKFGGSFKGLAFYNATGCRGDLNCDGRIDFADINPFVAALSGSTPCNEYNADVNGDGEVNFNDINPFVLLLTGGASCQ
jgi:hypothetical protein